MRHPEYNDRLLNSGLFFPARHPVLTVAGLAIVGASLGWGLIAVLDLKAPGGLLQGAFASAISDPAAAPILLKKGIIDYMHTAWGMGGPWLGLVSIQISILTIFTVFMALFALTSIVERKVLARIQNRYGPNRAGLWGMLQPVADGIKMLTKEDIVPRGGIGWMHLLAPVVLAVPAFLVLAILPYGPGMILVDTSVGILFFLALGATSEVAIFMAGWASENKYSLLGSMRAIAQMISYEMPLLLAALAVVMISGTLSPNTMVEAQAGYVFGFVPNWFVFTPWGCAAFLLFFIAALAESNRSPFDLPEGESELVAGHMTEYSGFRYAVFFMAEYIGLFGICGFAVALFLGGWHAPLPFLAFIPGYLWFFIKLYMLVLVAIWIRGTMPRVRIDQLMAFSWSFLLPTGFCILAATAVWHFSGGGLLGWLLSTPCVLAPYLFLLPRLQSAGIYATRHYQYAEE
ncbi:MAG: NADH-quinone oxidoreductase subunit NuoH [Opitutales bacterium]